MIFEAHRSNCKRDAQIVGFATGPVCLARRDLFGEGECPPNLFAEFEVGRARRLLRAPYGLLAGLATPGVSTLVTLITYVTVTVEPGLSSADPLIVAGSIANSNFSVPFSTESVVPVAATTVPVISYVFPPAANSGAANTRLIPVSK